MNKNLNSNEKSDFMPLIHYKVFFIQMSSLSIFEGKWIKNDIPGLVAAFILN